MTHCSVRPFVRRVCSWLGPAGLTLALGCTTSPDEDPFGTPISEACNACLSGSDDAGSGCSAEFQSCEELRACDENIVCALKAHCYEQPATDSCEEDVGCTIDPAADDASEATSRAMAFEQCARTTCADACGFAAP